MWRIWARLPLPLVFAVVMGVGATMYIVLVIDVPTTPLASWDPRYATSNGTHVFQTLPMPDVPYKTLYLGYGTAYFKNPVNVYYLRKVSAGGFDSDLGRYLPVVLVIESGSLPTDTYIRWTDPHTGRTRALYLVSGTNRGYVIGEYHVYGYYAVASIPVYYRVVGNMVYIYPMELEAINAGEACPIIMDYTSYAESYRIFAVLDSWFIECLYWGWEDIANVDWALVASSATMAELKPSPTHYMVTVNVGDNKLTIMLSYWYAVNKDPGHFVVRIGTD